jgi:hypothetical protein
VVSVITQPLGDKSDPILATTASGELMWARTPIHRIRSNPGDSAAVRKSSFTSSTFGTKSGGI